MPENVIPVIDLGAFLAGEPGALQGKAAELRDALTRFGFFFIRNHGVPDTLVAEAFAAAERFHDQPLDDKLALKINEHNIGYMPMRGATTRMNALDGVYKPNANEAIFFKRDLPADHPDVVANLRFRGMNQWPAALPGFRDTVCRYMDALEALGKSMLPLYATALDLPADFFAAPFADPMYTLRLSHYPQQDPMAPEDEWGLAPHADTSFMTILAQNKVPGLSVRLPSGEWVDAPVIPGTFLVNGGMMLRRWTNDRFLASPHRVTNRSGQERYAIPFFMDAGYEVEMVPLATCVDADHPPLNPPTSYAEFMSSYVRSNYHHQQDSAKSRTEVELQGA